MFELFNINNIALVLILVITLHISLFVLLFFIWNNYLKIFQPKLSCLIIIAHPDDEAMFFAPTIVRLINSGVRVFLLCLTTGNSNGLGIIRKRELGNAVQHLGMNSGDVTILDITEFQDGFFKWDETEFLAKIILKNAETLSCKWIITFDDSGISSHPNHISCFTAVYYLISKGFMPCNMQIFVLETVNTFRKYSSFFDIATSLLSSQLSSRILLLSFPFPTYKSMLCHKTQLVWFRYLYLIFSRYVIINTLRRLEVKKKCK